MASLLAGSLRCLKRQLSLPVSDDVAVVGDAVEQGRGYLGIAEHGRPFAEGEVGRDDHRGPLVELAEQVEQQLAARAGERQEPSSSKTTTSSRQRWAASVPALPRWVVDEAFEQKLDSRPGGLTLAYS